MDRLKSALLPPIPTSARVFGWIMVLAGSIFAYIYTVTPGTAFPGVGIASYSEQFGLYSTGVRIVAAVLGLIIALSLNSAALLALMLATRVVTESGDVVVGLVINHGVPDANTWSLSALALVEVYFTMKLVRVLFRGRLAVGQV